LQKTGAFQDLKMDFFFSFFSFLAGTVLFL